MRPEALTFAGRHLAPGWTVMDRLHEITAPTLVMAGREDFVYPPEHQGELAAGIPNAQLRIIERAGHNPQLERPAEVMAALMGFLPADPSLVTSHGSVKGPGLRTAGVLTTLGLAAAAIAVRRSRTNGEATLRH